jgi:signal transduction histidine kinase
MADQSSQEPRLTKSPTPPDVLEILKGHELFAGLEEQDLKRLVDMARPLHLEPGQVLMQEGSPGGSLYLVIDGEFQVTKRSGQQDVHLAVRGAGEVFGEMSVLDRSPRSATLVATQPSSLLELSQDAFRELLAASPQATLAILNTVTSRLRNTEGMLRQHEKMAGLGTLAAGLAHELNNPAAAIGRGASQIRSLIADWLKASADVGRLDLSEAETQVIKTFEAGLEGGGRQPESADLLARSDLEDMLTDWLEEVGIDDPWEYSGWLVAGGWTRGALEGPLQPVAPGHRKVILRWLAIGVSLFALADELREGASRISNLVGTVKTYAYLDQAPAQLVDVHQGLEDTLVVLKQKIGPGIEVERAYDPDLPRIEAFGSELNQVWTNLIDNALDAMGESGRLRLATQREGDQVAVEICDTGPGIPASIRDRVFEPFFTTKAPGVGTGLGLHIVYNIVCQRHGGSVHIADRSDLNCFRVELPIESPRRSESAAAPHPPDETS